MKNGIIAGELKIIEIYIIKKKDNNGSKEIYKGVRK